MQRDDDTVTPAGPPADRTDDAAGSDGRTSGGPEPPPLRTRVMIILTVSGVIALSGLLFMMTRTRGCDEPAPVLTTATTIEGNVGH